MEKIPKVKSVYAVESLTLIIEFDNHVKKEYDCLRIIHRPEFSPLKNKAYFRSVKVDPGGYGVSWSDDIDLSEYELWTNGKNTKRSYSCF